MDLHIVPGITARGVAEAHVLDLIIQEEFQCSCMTYWVDESNNSVFCLIEAPHENAVRELHERSHGLLPHHIIEVNKNTVSSFLGRLYDPVVPGLHKGELKVFNDPAYRTLILIDITDVVLLRNNVGKEDIEKLLNRFLKIIRDHSSRCGGEIIEHRENVTIIICFTSSSNAISCAQDIAGAFTHEEKVSLNLRISLNSGMPVSSSTRIFGETIDFGEQLLYTSRDHNIVVVSNMDSDRRHLDINQENISSLTPSQEKWLKKIFQVLELNSPDENFGIDDFCREAGLSRSSLNRHVQTLTARSPNTLLKEYRMNNALKLLRKGESISNVAYFSGFRSPSYFSKCFKEHYSLSPSEYMERLKFKLS